MCVYRWTGGAVRCVCLINEGLEVFKCSYWACTIIFAFRPQKKIPQFHRTNQLNFFPHSTFRLKLAETNPDICPNMSEII